MPPWHADPSYGSFSNDRSLTDDEKETILRWTKRGAPLGNPNDMPELPETAPLDEWALGEPDYVFEFNEVTVPGGGPDRFYDLSAKLDLPEDKFVRAVEILPGNRKVLHHVILDQRGSGGEEGWLAAWAAGTPPMVFREGTGRMVKKDARIVGDMHYHPAETTETDKTKVGLYFAEDAGKEVVNLWILNREFYIPAGDPNYEVRSEYTFSQDAYIHALFPHMHFRGKDFTYTAVYPDGKRETLLKVDDYDFNWQTYYVLEEPLAAPKGTRIECVAHYDNSANNPDNPDPTRSLGWGSESYDEMMIGFVDFTVADGLRPKEPKEIVAERARELHAKYPGDVYDVKLSMGFEQMPSALYLPRSGDAIWHISVMGVVREAALVDVVWDGGAFTGTVHIDGVGRFDCQGELEPAEGNVSGQIELPEEQGGFTLRFRGSRIE